MSVTLRNVTFKHVDRSHEFASSPAGDEQARVAECVQFGFRRSAGTAQEHGAKRSQKAVPRCHRTSQRRRCGVALCGSCSRHGSCFLLAAIEACGATTGTGPEAAPGARRGVARSSRRVSAAVAAEADGGADLGSGKPDVSQHPRVHGLQTGDLAPVGAPTLPRDVQSVYPRYEAPEPRGRAVRLPDKGAGRKIEGVGCRLGRPCSGRAFREAGLPLRFGDA